MLEIHALHNMKLDLVGGTGCRLSREKAASGPAHVIDGSYSGRGGALFLSCSCPQLPQRGASEMAFLAQPPSPSGGKFMKLIFWLLTRTSNILFIHAGRGPLELAMASGICSNCKSLVGLQ